MSDPSINKANPANPAARRFASRLAAVQALYQLRVNGGEPEEVISEFLRLRVKEEIDGISLAGLDRKLFERIVAGAAKAGEEFDDMLSAVLPDDWPIERVELLLKSVLHAALFELAEEMETPVRVVISQYLDVAHAFFHAKEPAFVNGILDRLARELRPDDFPSP